MHALLHFGKMHDSCPLQTHELSFAPLLYAFPSLSPPFFLLFLYSDINKTSKQNQRMCTLEEQESEE